MVSVFSILTCHHPKGSWRLSNGHWGSDQPSTHPGSAYPGVAIYDPERSQNTKDMVNFSKLLCFDHNFLPNTVINFIFWPVTYNIPNLSKDTLVGHKRSCHNGHYSRMAIMATIAPLKKAIIMANMGVYWKIKKSVDHLSKNLIDYCVR